MDSSESDYFDDESFNAHKTRWKNVLKECAVS